MEKLERSYVAGENIRWCSPCPPRIRSKLTEDVKLDGLRWRGGKSVGALMDEVVQWPDLGMGVCRKGRELGVWIMGPLRDGLRCGWLQEYLGNGINTTQPGQSLGAPQPNVVQGVWGSHSDNLCVFSGWPKPPGPRDRVRLQEND